MTATDPTGSDMASSKRTPRRWPGRLVAAILLCLVLVLGGGGWYFSGVIHSDGLAVAPDAPRYDLEVTDVDEEGVTIADPADEEPALDGDDVWGVGWSSGSGGGSEAGYGQVSGVPTGGDDVRRALTVLSGRAPRVGDHVDLDRSGFPDEPEVALGRRVRTVRYGPGSFPAWYVPGKDRTWAVLVHGKGQDRAEMLRMMRSTVARGLPSLAISYRNDDGAAPDDSGLYQFGRTEWADLDAAVRYAQRQGADDVVLVGASMGGAIIASYLRHVPEAPVGALVLDSPMLDCGATVSHGASQLPLPVVGAVPEPLTWTAKRLATLRYGIDWEEVDYLTDTSWLTAPTLLFHGSQDETVPLAASERLAEARSAEVDLVIVPGAGHVASWNSDPGTYDATVTAFLGDVVPTSPRSRG